MLSKKKAVGKAIRVLASITSPYDLKVQLKKGSYKYTTVIKSSGMPLVNINDKMCYKVSTNSDPKYYENCEVLNNKEYDDLTAETKISYVRGAINDLIDDISDHGGLYGFSVTVLKVGKDLDND